MSDTEQTELLKRLERMEESLAQIRACLLGEFGGQTGLIPEHRQCQQEFCRWRAKLDSIEVDVAELKLAKVTTETGLKWSWQTAAIIILSVVWIAEKMKLI